MCAGSPRLGVLRRLRPVPTRSVDGGPSPVTRAGSTAAGRGPRRFPCSLTIRSTKEEPNSVPAASPRLPRSTSPWPPDQTSTCPPEVPHRTIAGGCAPHPAHIRQVGAGEPLRDVPTLVPHVLLSVTLAGPTPSDGAGASRLCQGCSHPPRHLPRQAALSFNRPAATRRRRRSLTSVQNVSASRRTWIKA